MVAPVQLATGAVAALVPTVIGPALSQALPTDARLTAVLEIALGVLCALVGFGNGMVSGVKNGLAAGLVVDGTLRLVQAAGLMSGGR